MKSAIAIVIIACFVAVQTQYGRRTYGRIRPPYNCRGICNRYRFEPKCSERNVTHINDCHLECEWEYKECDGECPCMIKVTRESYCYCPKVYSPVCTYRGETKDNKCVADCQNLAIAHDGPCWNS